MSTAKSPNPYDNIEESKPGGSSSFKAAGSEHSLSGSSGAVSGTLTGASATEVASGEQRSSSSPEVVKLGEGPPLEVVDRLPTPEEVFKVPKLDPWRLFVIVLGPSFLALGGALGSGEWIMGPAVAARYGMYLFWLVWVAVILQTIYNIAYARITMAIGEPALVYMVRNKPKAFWTPFLTIVLFLSFAWPGWALAAATALGVFILGRLPGPGEAAFVRILGIFLFLLCLFVVLIGGKIAATLELVFRFKVLFVTAIVFILALIVTPREVWGEFLRGLVSIGYIPSGVDIFLIAGWWAYIGWASTLNFLLTNYYRDKGYSMGYMVGYIPAVIGGKKVPLSPTGKIFKLTSENLSTWKHWERILLMDQWLIYAIFAFLGMVLPSIFVRSMVPPGTELPAWAIAAHVAKELGARWGPLGFYLIAFIGVIVLWGTQLQVMDMLTRNLTDLLWSSSASIRRWVREDVRMVYYGIFIAYMLFAMWAIWQAPPLTLLLISANMANFAGLWAWYLLWRIDKELPRELRLPWYYWPGVLLLCAICSIFFIAFVLRQLKLI